ncbi:MAG: hypothetical protein ACI88H_002074 [Cocleimonas sp.]|jgi:hypothetical protein
MIALNRRRQSIALIYKIHRYLGLVAALFLIWLSISGVFLNHTEDLKLDQKHLQSRVINKLYSVKEAELGKAFHFDNNWLVQLGSNILLNQQLLLENTNSLVALLNAEEYFLIGTIDQVRLFTKTGELIDNLKTPALLENMAWYSIADDKKLIVRTTAGNYLANEDITDWLILSPEDTALNKDSIQWSKEAQLPIKKAQLIINTYQGKGPTLEQVILDTHSGRIFGKLGVYFADFIAFSTIVLTLLGIYLWWRRLRR